MSLKAKERREDDMMKDEDRKMLSSQTNSSDPKSLNARVFIGNLPTDKVTRQEIEEKFSKFGKVAGVSLHRGFAFVQYDLADDAEAAAKQENGSMFKNCKIEVNVASLRRKEKDDRISRPPPAAPRRRTPPPYDDRRRREYRDRSPHRDGNLLDDRARRDLQRYSRDDRLREDRLREPYYDVGTRKSYDDIVPERRFGPREEPVKFRRESGPDNYREQFNEPADSRYPNDCEILVANKQCRAYAEMVEARLKTQKLRTDLLFPRENSSIPNILDDIARRGCLYTIVILQQNEQHKSVTVNILWGKPQEHRNMPLDDALSLIARNFDSYMQSVRDRIPTATALRDRSINEMALASSYPPVAVESGVQVLLNLLADGRPLSVPEIDRVIRHLQDRKERLLKDAEVSVTAQQGLYNKPIDTPLGPPPPQKTVQDQQAELQKRILSILNHPASATGNAAIASAIGSASISSISNNWSEPHANNSNQSSSVVNFDNPNVQQALDNLIQSGPALLRSLKGVGNSNVAVVNQGQLAGQIKNNPVIAQAQRPLQSPPISIQQQQISVAAANNFGLRNPMNPQQQRHPLLGTLTPVSPGLMSRGAVGARRF